MTEDEISTAFEKMLIGRSITERSRLLDIFQLKVIDAKKGQSIVLYIYCETVEELLRLQELLTSGCLKDAAERLFNKLLTRSQEVAVENATLNDEEFKRMKAYFTGDQLFNFNALICL